MKPIHYEKHPVSAERKAELLILGFKIVDLKFKPADAVDVAVAENPKKRTKKSALMES